MNRLLLPFLILLIIACETDTSSTSNSSESTSQVSPEGKTILAIFAHPDDEATVGPLLSKYSREGAVVHLVAVTDGRYGVTEHAGIPAGDSLAKVREQEFICAGEVLGASSVKVLGYHDQLKMQEGFQPFWQGFTQIRDEVANLFEVLQPDVVITWNSSGWTGHPDHRLVSSIVTEVFESRDWGKPASLFYPGLPAQNIPDGMESPVAVVDMKFLSVAVPCSEQDLSTARQAWACHKSQYTQAQLDELWGLITTVNGGNVYLIENVPGPKGKTSIF